MSTQEPTAAEPQAEEVLSGIESLNDLTLDLLSPDPPQENQEPEKEPEKEEAEEVVEGQEEATESEEAPETEEEPKEEDFSGFKKRIDKLTSQKYELKGELEANKKRLSDLESKIAKAEKKGSNEGDLDALVGSVSSLEELDEITEDAISELRWARRMQSRMRRDPDSVDAEVRRRFGDKVTDVDAFVDELVLNAEEAKDYSIPKARKRLEETAQWTSAAEQAYPWLQDSSHKATSIVEQSLKDYGDMKLKDIPNAKLTLARAVMGYHYEQQAAEKAKNPKPKAPKAEPTPQPGPASAPPVDKSVSRSNKADNAAQAVYGGGGKDAFTDFVKAALLPD